MPLRETPETTFKLTPTFVVEKHLFLSHSSFTELHSSHSSPPCTHFAHTHFPPACRSDPERRRLYRFPSALSCWIVLMFARVTSCSLVRPSPRPVWASRNISIQNPRGSGSRPHTRAWVLSDLQRISLQRTHFFFFFWCGCIKLLNAEARHGERLISNTERFLFFSSPSF